MPVWLPLRATVRRFVRARRSWLQPKQASNQTSAASHALVSRRNA